MAWRLGARALVVALSLAGTLGATLVPDARADEAADKKAASEAYERGARAFGQGSYASAAADFARADELAPAPAALEAALKAAISADDPVLAMTLADRADGRPHSDAVAAQVTRARERFADRVGKLTVLCAAPCTARVGDQTVPVGAPRYHRTGNHVLEITTGAAPPELFAVQLAPRATLVWTPPAKTPPPATAPAPDLTPSAPPSAAPTAAASSAPGPRSTAVPPATAPSSSPPAPGLSPAWFALGAGLTAVAAGATVGFGLDALSQHDAFLADRTEDRAAAGRDAQLRTNLFLGVTAATAVTTAVLAYFVFRAPPARSAAARAPQLAW